MPWIDPWGNQYIDLPMRIRLADFTTRTCEAVTPEAATEGGWTFIEALSADPVPTIVEELVDQPIEQQAFDSVSGGF